MDEPALRQLLDDVRAGTLSADDAVRRLRRLPFADLGFARVDHHRALRQNMPEAVCRLASTSSAISVRVASSCVFSFSSSALSRAAVAASTFCVAAQSIIDAGISSQSPRSRLKYRTRSPFRVYSRTS